MTDVYAPSTGDREADLAVSRARDELIDLDTDSPARLTWVARGTHDGGHLHVVMFDDGTPDLPFWIVPDDPYQPVASEKLPARWFDELDTLWEDEAG